MRGGNYQIPYNDGNIRYDWDKYNLRCKELHLMLNTVIWQFCFIGATKFPIKKTKKTGVSGVGLRPVSNDSGSQLGRPLYIP